MPAKNPFPLLRHRFQVTHSLYGKAALQLFHMLPPFTFSSMSFFGSLLLLSMGANGTKGPLVIKLFYSCLPLSFLTNKLLLLSEGANQNEGLLVTQLFYMLPPLFDTLISQWDLFGPILILMRKALEITEEDILLAREVLEYYTGKILI
jgi:hypothetical protein